MSTSIRGRAQAVPIILSTLGQIPSFTIATDHPISLYQPAVYVGKELFLLVPFMVAIVATWAVILWRQAMWAIFALFLVTSVCVYLIYNEASATSALHPINWIMSYCAFALLIAALGRLLVDAYDFFFFPAS